MEIKDEKTKLMTVPMHPERDKGKLAEAGYCNKLQVSWSNCFR